MRCIPLGSAESVRVVVSAVVGVARGCRGAGAWSMAVIGCCVGRGESSDACVKCVAKGMVGGAGGIKANEGDKGGDKNVSLRGWDVKKEAAAMKFVHDEFYHGEGVRDAGQQGVVPIHAREEQGGQGGAFRLHCAVAKERG